MKASRNIDRRGFVEIAAAGVASSAGLCAAGTALAADAQETGAAPGLLPPENIDEVLDCDIVVVGAGASGLPATLQAAELGYKVLCLEKGESAGGNCVGTQGIFAIGSKMQEELGIHYTPADIVHTELRESQWRGDGSIWLDLCEKSGENIDWLDQHGVIFSGEVDNYHTGSHATMHWMEPTSPMRATTSYIAPLVAACETAGAEFRYNVGAYLLIQGEDGAVQGLYAQDVQSGAQLQINARAVILASGGLGLNPDLLIKKGWLQYNIDHMITMATPTVVGDGYLMAMAAGAYDDIAESCNHGFIAIEALGTDFVQPYDSPLNSSNGICGCGPTIWVNQDAMRFNDESIAFLNVANCEAACLRAYRETYTIFDQKVVDNLLDDPFDVQILEDAVSDPANAQSIVRADSIAELAQNFGLDAEVLEEQVARYNAYCEAGEDADFGKDPQYLVKLEPPFYMGRLVPMYLANIGGIKTNVRCEVLDKQMFPIPGLYAVGLDGAMTHKNLYTQNLPAGIMGNNVNSGRNAARSAAEYIEGV